MSEAVAVQTPRERGERIAFRRGVSLLVLTLLVPGSAQVIAGGRGLGRFAMKVWLVIVGVLALFTGLALVRLDWAVALYAHPWTQWVLSVVVAVLGVGWALLLLDAWRLSRPGGMGTPRKYWMAGLAAVLAFAVGAGSAHASTLSRSQADLFGRVFAGGGSAKATDGRLNILLIGADAEPARPGIRTDTIMVASVSEPTGRTVLFSLPRNLQHAPVPESSPLHEVWPDGYWCADESCLLNAVHTEGEKHADRYPSVRSPGLQAVRETVSEILGLSINYYAMVDMRGFEQLIDALGGVPLDIAKAVPIGGGSARVEGYIESGTNVHLNGYQALWFARSRHGGSDYERMARQKCVVNAVAKQVTPLTLVTPVTALAAAGGSGLSTDVPTSQLARLEKIADAGRRLPIASTSFAPPLIQPVKPDFAFIRQTVQEDLERSVALDKEAEEAARAAEAAAAAAAASASASPSGEPAAAAPEPTAEAPASTEPGQEAVIVKSAPKATASVNEERRTGDLEEICSA